MVFSSIEKAFCVLEYAQTNLNKTVQHAFMKEFSKKSLTTMQIWTRQKKFKDESRLCREKGPEDQQHRTTKWSGFAKNSLKPQKVHKKNKSK